MLKLFKYTLIILSVFKSITLSNEVYYKDRIIFYVDNRVSNFKIENDHKTVSINDLNNILENENVLKIEKWLPMSRPTDQNGQIYLNRYYVIKFNGMANAKPKRTTITAETPIKMHNTYP